MFFRLRTVAKVIVSHKVFGMLGRR